MNLFELSAKIGIDTSKYEQGISKAKADAEGFKNGFQSVGAKTIAVGHLMANGIQAAGSKIFELGKIGLSYNAQMESYTSNFKVMLGSTEKGIQKVEELKALAAKTPFGMEDLAKATQQLLAFQVPAEETDQILRMLGDVSLGNKEKLQGLALVFGQVSSAGKLTGQDLMQFINQGFNPLNYIAQRTGESMNELRDRMSKGAIGIDEVKQAFVDATSEGGQFYKGMEEGSKTTAGLMSTLTDTVKGKLGELFETASGKLAELLPQAIEFVENLDATEITAKIQALLNVIKFLTPIVIGATVATKAYAAALAISALIKTFQKALEGATIAQKLMNLAMMANPIGLVVGLITGLIAAIVALWMTNEDFRNKVKAIFGDIKNFISGVVNTIVNFFTETIPNAFTTFKTAVSNICSKVASIFTTVIPNALKSVVTSAVEWGKNLIVKFANGFISMRNNLLNKLSNFLWNLLPSPFQGIARKAITWGKDLIDNFVSGIWANISKVINAAKNVAKKVKDFLGFSEPKEGPLSNFHTYAPDMMQLFTKGIKDNEKLITGQIAKSFNFKPTIGEAIANIPAGQGSKGVSIVQNIHSKAQTAADLMQEALYQQERAVYMGV